MFTTPIFFLLIATSTVGISWKMIRKINVNDKVKIPLSSLLEISARRLILLIAIVALTGFVSSSIVKYTIVEASDAEMYVKKDKCEEMWSGIGRDNLQSLIVSCKEGNESKDTWENSQQYQAMKSSPLYSDKFFMFITINDIKESAMFHADFVEMMLKSAGKEEEAFNMKQTLSEATEILILNVKLSESSWPAILSAIIIYSLTLGGVFILSIFRAVKSKSESHSTDVVSVFSAMFVKYFWSICFAILTINIYI